MVNFNRFFTNLSVLDEQGATVETVDELRYANITMITWTSGWRPLGMTYGALAGIPFATGNLTPSSEDVGSTSFGLGDVLVTPVSLYGVSPEFDYQFQFTYWTASGKFARDAAELKALATYCHAIMNSAAFLYVD